MLRKPPHWMNPLQISAAQDIKNTIKVRTGTENWVYLTEAGGEGKDDFPREKNPNFCPWTQHPLILWHCTNQLPSFCLPWATRGWFASSYSSKISWRPTNEYIWLKYSLLELPGVLNWEVSRNFRGVDKLVTSIRGTGEASFTRDLWEGRELKQAVDYHLQSLFPTNNPLIPYILSLRNRCSHFHAFCQLNPPNFFVATRNSHPSPCPSHSCWEHTHVPPFPHEPPHSEMKTFSTWPFSSPIHIVLIAKNVSHCPSCWTWQGDTSKKSFLGGRNEEGSHNGAQDVCLEAKMLMETCKNKG